MSRFVIDVPSDWQLLDLSAEALASSRAAALEGTADPAVRTEINEMFRQGRNLLRAARELGALWAGGTATVYDDGLLLAYGMVVPLRLPPGADLTLPVLARRLSVDGRGASKRAVSSGDLPAVGTVARVTGVETVEVTAELAAPMITMQTVIPQPGSEQDFLVLCLVSPNLDFEEEVVRYFDGISSTFRFVDESTDDRAAALR